MTAHPSLKLTPDKRAILFGVARHEFAERGFGQASLNRIIGEVGMSKSSFYHYFDSKTDLFHQTLEENLIPFLSLVDGVDLTTLNAKSFWSVLEDLAHGMAAAINQNPDFILVGRMFYRSREHTDDFDLTNNLISVSSAYFEKLLETGQALGVVRADVPNSFLMDGIMALGMAIDRWMIGHWEEMDDQQRRGLQKQAFDMFVRLLEKR